MYILTTELKPGHMKEKKLHSVVEEDCCFADLEKTIQADGIQIREVLSLAIWFKCCWEMNQGVEGSEQAPEQLSAFYSLSKVYWKTEKSHICGKWNYFVFMLI